VTRSSLALLLGARCLTALCLAAPLACDEAAPRERDAIAPPVPAAMPSARRPTRQFYFARTPERCELYWVDQEELSKPEPHPCVRELEAGERIRLVGKTCMRESSRAERQVPVLCPYPLTAAESAWLETRTPNAQPRPP
jgi:hypothetical protein